MKRRVAVMWGFKIFQHAAITISIIELIHRNSNGRHFRMGVKVERRPQFGTPYLASYTPQQRRLCLYRLFAPQPACWPCAVPQSSPLPHPMPLA